MTCTARIVLSAAKWAVWPAPSAGASGATSLWRPQPGALLRRHGMAVPSWNVHNCLQRAARCPSHPTGDHHAIWYASSCGRTTATTDQLNLVPLWPSLRSAAAERTRKTQPTCWAYDTLRLLMRAGDPTPMEKAERRAGHNQPRPGKMQASAAIYLGMQLLLPGEAAATATRPMPCA